MSRLILFGTVLAAWIGASADNAFHEERSIEKTLRFAGAGVHTLDVRAMSGAMRVSGYEGSEVLVEARTRISAESEEALGDARRDVAIETADGAATVSLVVHQSDRPACGESGADRSRAWWDRRRYEATVDVTIRVPRDARLRLCTIDGRDVRVDDTSGDFDIQNVNGRIELQRMRGSGRAATVNGGVTATFLAAPREASLFKTVNGSIVVTLPADASADLRLKTFHGGLFTDFDVVPQAPASVPSAERLNGKYVYRSRGFTAVRIGHGGPELAFDAFNGDVRVLRAER